MAKKAMTKAMKAMRGGGKFAMSKGQRTVRKPCGGQKKVLKKGDPSRWATDEKIAFVLKNPKLPSGAGGAFERFQRYKHAKTVQQALDNGAFKGDLKFDFQHGYMWRKPESDRNDIAYVVSLGTRCVVAEVLRDAGLRRFACPFDWIYSSSEMVAHCLKNNFKSFLDTSQITKSGVQFGHKQYSRMLGRGIIYPHHNPLKCADDFKRRVARLNKVISSSKRKLFVICDIHQNPALLQGAQERKGAPFKDVFSILQKKGCDNFELLAINVICDKASEARSCDSGGSGKMHGPVIQKLDEQGCKAKRNHLTVYNLHCTGSCTGLRLKEKQDSEALGKLCSSDHTFDLAEDPDTNDASGDVSKKPASHEAKTSRVLYPRRTVKKFTRGKRVIWSSKRMD